jgi:F420H(2)-dependent quinone reductase
MAYLKPGFMVRRVMNPISSIAGTSLRVKRRKTGGMQVVPVLVLKHEGARYLVAPRGDPEWARNLRAAGGDAELARMGKREPIHATEVPREERAPLVDAYVNKWGFAVGSQFKALPDPADHATFRIESAA